MCLVVVPGYYLAWYNCNAAISGTHYVVVPGYYLAWYNIPQDKSKDMQVVVPGYYLAWYNRTVSDFYWITS